nr:nicalin-1 [Tanacetum cinerariifolium]
GLSNVAEEVGVTVGLKHKKINGSNSRMIIQPRVLFPHLKTILLGFLSSGGRQGRGRLDRKGAAALREGVEVGWFGTGEEKGGKGRGGR